MSVPLVKLEKDGESKTIITLNRPEKRNALNMALMKELAENVARVERDKSQRILILKGAGPVFCAGLDLEESSDSRKADRAARLVATTLVALNQSRLVTIAAVHGAALAGGAGVMSACDLVVASRSAKIGYPETRRGLLAALVMTFLRRQLHERDIRELLFCGESISADRAKEIGLVNRVVDPETIMQEVRSLSDSVLKSGPAAIRKTKQFLDELWPSTVKKDVAQALRFHMKTRHSKEAEEGIRAFLDRRDPKWSEV